MKRGYRFGVAWIALNDSAGVDEPVDQIAGWISTLLLADLFDKDADKVAQDIVKVRNEQKRIREAK